MPDTPPTEPPRNVPPRLFILLRPLFDLRRWLFPATVADKDRQSAGAKLLGRIVIGAFCVLLTFLGVRFAKPLQDAFQDWRASQLIAEATRDLENRQIANAWDKAQKAVSMAPNNIAAIRFNAEILTKANRPEAQYFFRRLEAAGVATPQDRLLQVRSLVMGRQQKEAEQALELLFTTREPDDEMMELAAAVWSGNKGEAVLLRLLKEFAAQHPENRRHSLRLARVQARSESSIESRAGFRLASELAHGDDEIGLQALELLNTFETLPPDEAQFLIKRLRAHPLAKGRHLVGALDRQMRLEPMRRSVFIQEAVESARSREREDLAPLVRWLLEQGEHLQVLAVLGEEKAKSSRTLLENYLTALTMLKRFDDLQRMVNDPEVAKLLSLSVTAFYRAHLAFVLRKEPAIIRDSLTKARLAAVQEKAVEVLVNIAKYAEERGYLDIAEAAFRDASLIPGEVPVLNEWRRKGYIGLLRTAQRNNNTESLMVAAREACAKWPEDASFKVVYGYASLLLGADIELAKVEIEALLELRPEDPEAHLLAAFAHWRFGDMDEAMSQLQRMQVNALTPGQQIIFAAIARDTGANNAQEAAAAVLGQLDPKARLLPEERALLARLR